MRESRIQRALMVGIKALGGTAEKFSSPARRFVPDLLAGWPATAPQSDMGEHESVVRPLTEFIEAKTLGGKLTSGQKRDHERRRAMGYRVLVIWSREQVEAYLVSRGKK